MWVLENSVGLFVMIWPLRYNLATLLQMPPDSKDFEKATLIWPQDDGWDESDPVEKAYKTAGLKRFDLNFKNTFGKVVEKEVAEEKMVTITDAVKLGGNELTNIEAEIKVENEHYLKAFAQIRIVGSSEGSLSKLHRDLKKMHAELVAAGDSRCGGLNQIKHHLIEVCFFCFNQNTLGL